jgi:hypothetical protein
MHNWTDPGATSVICDTATSQPKPPFHCRTDGCISISNPDTWLALDWVQKNTTLPTACNSNHTWVGRCYCEYSHSNRTVHHRTSSDRFCSAEQLLLNICFASDCGVASRFGTDTHAPTGIAVAKKAQTLLIAHGAESPPVIRAFDKTGGRQIGTLAVAAAKLAMAPDDGSFWAMPMPIGPEQEGSEVDTRIVRYATPVENQEGQTSSSSSSGSSSSSRRSSSRRRSSSSAPTAAATAPVPPKELAAVTGMTTACAIAVHPTTSELYVTDRKTQRFLVFPAAGGAAAASKPWGESLKLNFPYVSSLEAEGGALGCGNGFSVPFHIAKNRISLPSQARDTHSES